MGTLFHADIWWAVTIFRPLQKSALVLRRFVATAAEPIIPPDLRKKPRRPVNSDGHASYGLPSPNHPDVAADDRADARLPAMRPQQADVEPRLVLHDQELDGAVVGMDHFGASGSGIQWVIGHGSGWYCSSFPAKLLMIHAESPCLQFMASSLPVGSTLCRELCGVPFSECNRPG